jgi:DNA-binding SARP family transcriptional activator
LEVILKVKSVERNTDLAGREGHAAVRIEILGMLALWQHESELSVGPPQQRAVLGLLALHHNTRISRSSISEMLWPGKQPASAVKMIQIYTAHIRALLDDTAGPTLVTTRSGYMLRAAAADLDALAFCEAVMRARMTARTVHPLAALEDYERACRLWRGEPAADVDQLRGCPAAEALAEQWRSMLAEYATIAIRLGEPERVLPLLRAAAADLRLDERLQARLILALARAGRQFEALHVYEEIRRRVRDELGLDPCAELREAHMQVLTQAVGPMHGPDAPSAARV